jgi:hypothetical protein
MQGSTANTNEQASSAWSSIFSPKIAPLCSSHGEPCKQWTVNKRKSLYKPRTDDFEVYLAKSSSWLTIAPMFLSDSGQK